MRNENLQKVYLNWKGIELFNNLKYIVYILSFILSIIFIFTSSKSSQSFFVFGISIILLFSQFLKENKEPAKKYRAIFEKINSGKKISNYKEWIDFLDRTYGLNSLYLWVIGKCGYNKKFEAEIYETTNTTK